MHTSSGKPTRFRLAAAVFFIFLQKNLQISGNTEIVPHVSVERLEIWLGGDSGDLEWSWGVGMPS